MKTVFAVVFILLAVMLIDQAYAYEGSAGQVYGQMRSDSKTAEDYVTFVKEVEDWIKTQDTPEDFADRKLLKMIVKMKSAYEVNSKKAVEKEERVEKVIEIVKVSKAKKEFQKIKNKIVIDSINEHTYNDIDLDVEVLKHVLGMEDPRLLDMGVKGVVKQYKNFEEFNEKEFIEELELLKEDMDIEKITTFVDNTRDTVDSIKQNRDASNSQQDDKKSKGTVTTPDKDPPKKEKKEKKEKKPKKEKKEKKEKKPKKEKKKKK
jgi:hypothetical protein